ncbi:hypothetical protein glysoja_009011 [Glycine soja]|nr:hypothetical protein glysoja_009011 [Glycine soja]
MSLRAQKLPKLPYMATALKYALSIIVLTATSSILLP